MSEQNEDDENRDYFPPRKRDGKTERAIVRIEFL